MTGRLLGLHGRAGAGKSTIAQAMIADGSAALLHFASPIKSMARAIGLTEAQVNGAEKDQPTAMLGGCTPRRFLQQLGRDLRGTRGADVVAGWTLVHVDRLLAHGMDVILDDVRLVSEAAGIWERQGVVIELTGWSPIELDSESASDVLEQRLEDRWIHDTISNCRNPNEVAQAVRHCWHDTIACVGASRAW